MTLKLGTRNIFDQPGLFRISPQDDDFLVFQGGREIPASTASGQSFSVTKGVGLVAEETSVGTVGWTNDNNIKLDDETFANTSTTLGEAALINLNSIRLVKAGVISGDDLTQGGITTENEYYPFGGVSNLWGLTLTAEDVNKSTFGCVVAFNGDFATSYYLKSTAFSFGIPLGATIDGVQATVRGKFINAGAITKVYLDYISITIHYTVN